jgi:hypothetical protein
LGAERKNSFMMNKNNNKETFHYSSFKKIDTQPLLMTLHLQKITSLLSSVDATPHLGYAPYNDPDFFKESAFLGAQLYSKSNTKSILADSNFKNNYGITTFEHKKDRYYTNYLFLQVRTVPLTYATTHNFNFMTNKILVNNLRKNLFLAKQSRWFWKSSILSDKLILKNLSITNLKKLYGSPYANTGTTNTNV